MKIAIKIRKFLFYAFFLLFGSVVSAQIPIVTNSFDTTLVECEPAPKFFEFDIESIENAVIDTAYFAGDFADLFGFYNGFPDEAPGALYRFKIAYNPAFRGIISAQLRMKINGEFRNIDVTVSHPITRGLVPETVYFYAGQTSKSINLLNTGTVPINLEESYDFGDFVVDGILETGINPGESVTARARFVGAGKAIYDTTVNFFEFCDDTAKIRFYASPEPGNPVLRADRAIDGTIDFGRLTCRDGVYDSLDFKNVGTSALSYDTLIIVGKDASDFTFEQYQDYAIQPGLKHTYKITFEPKSAGTKTAKMIFVADPSNPFLGDREIDLIGRKDSVGFLFEESVALFRGDADSFSDIFSLINTGDVSLYWQEDLDWSFSIFPDKINESAIHAFRPRFSLPGEPSSFELGFSGMNAISPFYVVKLTGTVCDFSDDMFVFIVDRETNIGPQIAARLNVEAPDSYCSEPTQTLIRIYNLGNEILDIEGIRAGGGLGSPFGFSDSNGPLPWEILPGEYRDAIIDFTPQGAGFYEDDIIIESNTSVGYPIEIGNKDFVVNISGRNLLSSFSFSESPVEFLVEESETARKKVYVNNTGQTEITLSGLPFSNEKFDVSQMSPETISPGGVGTILVDFKGGEAGENYNEDVSVTEKTCLVARTLGIRATVKDPAGPTPDYPSSVDFGSILCAGDSLVKTIVIRNLGTADLIIYGITVEGGEGAFTTPITTETTIEPSGSHSIDVVFKPSEPGDYQAELKFTVNTSTGVFNVDLFGKMEEIAYEIDPISLNLGSFGPNETGTKTATISNSGTADLQWNEGYSSGDFTLVSVTPNPTPADDSSIVTVKFNGSSEFGEKTSFFDFVDPCGTSKRLNVTATVADVPTGLTLKIGSVEADPPATFSARVGEKFSAPLVLLNPNDADLSSAESLTAEISFNYTMLYPDKIISDRGVQLLDDTWDFETRTVRFAVDLPDEFERGKIADLRFLAALGDDSTCALELGNVSISGIPNPQIETRDGLFKLTNYCEHGGARLIQNNENLVQLLNLSPNPSSGSFVVEFEIASESFIRIELVDMNGKVLSTLASGSYNEGKHTEYLDLKNAPVGRYYLRLRNEAGSVSTKLEVVR